MKIRGDFSVFSVDSCVRQFLTPHGNMFLCSSVKIIVSHETHGTHRILLRYFFVNRLNRFYRFPSSTANRVIRVIRVIALIKTLSAKVCAVCVEHSTPQGFCEFCVCVKHNLTQRRKGREALCTFVLLLKKVAHRTHRTTQNFVPLLFCTLRIIALTN